MREIKFRAWDREKKKMYEVENICFYGHKSVTLQYNPVIKKAIDDIEIMQFTGMKDCAGKEIYDGDIVRTDDEDEELATIDWGDDTLKFMVTHGNVCSDLGEYYPRDIEVIGNIYDNPELLRGDAK